MSNSSLIVSIVRRGWGSKVLDAALNAGARGSTVLFGRGAGINEQDKIFGVSIEPEKEIVLTVAYEEQIDAILDAFNHGVLAAEHGEPDRADARNRLHERDQIAGFQVLAKREVVGMEVPRPIVGALVERLERRGETLLVRGHHRVPVALDQRPVARRHHLDELSHGPPLPGPLSATRPSSPSPARWHAGAG